MSALRGSSKNPDGKTLKCSQGTEQLLRCYELWRVSMWVSSDRSLELHTHLPTEKRLSKEPDSKMILRSIASHSITRRWKMTCAMFSPTCIFAVHLRMNSEVSSAGSELSLGVFLSHIRFVEKSVGHMRGLD